MPRNEGETHGRVGACVATRVVKTLSQMESLLTLMNADSERNLSGGAAQIGVGCVQIGSGEEAQAPLGLQ